MRTNLQRPDCRPFAWARNSLLPVPGAYAPGFMLAPAPQAKSRFFVQGRFNALCTKSPLLSSSLCNLCVLCASVVVYSQRNHRATENTEGAQRVQFSCKAGST